MRNDRQPYTVELTEPEVYGLYALLASGLLVMREQDPLDPLLSGVAQRVRDALRPAVVARRVASADAIIDGADSRAATQ